MEQNKNMEQVKPVSPVAPWLGAKTRLYPRIVAKIDTIPHRSYIEPFVGMGGVFLRRRFRPRLEVANDRNGEIVNMIYTGNFRKAKRQGFPPAAPPPGE